MAQLWRDLRLAFRVLRKSQAITAVALLSLALGIGANTAIFSLLNAVLLRPLPVPHPEQLVSLATTIFDQKEDNNFTWPMVQEITRQQQIFSDLSAGTRAASSMMPMEICRCLPTLPSPPSAG
jgi:hypothetical protein